MALTRCGLMVRVTAPSHTCVATTAVKRLLAPLPLHSAKLQPVVAASSTAVSSAKLLASSEAPSSNSLCFRALSPSFTLLQRLLAASASQRGLVGPHRACTDEQNLDPRTCRRREKSSRLQLEEHPQPKAQPCCFRFGLQEECIPVMLGILPSVRLDCS